MPAIPKRTDVNSTAARFPCWRRILREAAVLGSLVLVLLSARSSLADHYLVPSGSMLPTVQEGDRILVNKLAYGFRLPFSQIYLKEFGGPARGEVVVLASPDDGTVLLKRVVAVPGDVVAVQGGRIVLNGRAVPMEARGGEWIETLGESTHSVRFTNGGGPAFGPVDVPDGHYLVLGDNRGNSRDGRFFGFVERSAILGRAVGVFARDGAFRWEPL